MIAPSVFLLTLGRLLRFGDLHAAELPAPAAGHAVGTVGSLDEMRRWRADEPMPSSFVRTHGRVDPER